MKLAAIFFIGLSFLLNGFNSEPKNADLEAFKVIEKRTEFNGVYYSYVIKNVGTTPIPSNSYQVFFKVNGKTISFDKASSAIEPGQTIVYESKKIFYKKVDENLNYSLEVRFKDSNLENNTLKGVTEF